MPNLNELYDERCRIDKEQRDLNESVLAREDQTYTAEENEKWDKMDKRFNELADLIKNEEAREAELKKRAENLANRGDLSKSDKKEVRSEPPKIEKATVHDLKVAERYADAFRAFREETGGRYAQTEYRDAFREYLRGETRALQADLDVYGGFVATPEQFIADVIQDKDRMVFMRRLARVIPVPRAESLGVPVLDNDPADPVWTHEIATGDEDSTMSFEKRSLLPHPCAKLIRV